MQVEGMEGSPSTAKLSVWRGGSGETGGGGLRTITLSIWGSDPVSKHHHCAGLRGVTQCPQHSPTFVGGLPCPPTSVTGDSTPVPNNHNHEGRTSPCLQVPAWLHFGVSPHIPKHRDSRTFGMWGGRVTPCLWGSLHLSLWRSLCSPSTATMPIWGEGGG